MSDLQVARPGQINLAGDEFAMFLKLFSGEVLTTFDTENIMMGLHLIRTIPHGKSASFPKVGEIESLYHTPGQEIDGQDVAANEIVINVDGLLIARSASPTSTRR